MNAVMIEYKDWKKERQKGIGGSDVAAALGVSRWKSRLRLYLEKIGEIEHQPDNEFMYWGRKLEPLVIEHFSEVTGKVVEKVYKTLIHPEHDFMIAHLDGYIPVEDAIVEAKTGGEYAISEWDDGIPLEYLLQGQHYLAVTGCSKVYYPVLIGGNKFFIREMLPDEELIEMIIEGEKKFWEHVEKKIPPEMDSSKDSETLLKLLYPESREGAVVELPALENIAEQLVAVQKQIKELEKMEEDLEFKIKQELKDAEVGLLGKYKVSWKTVTSERLDTTKLKQDDPELYKKYSVVSSSRRFSIKELKEK